MFTPFAFVKQAAIAGAPPAPSFPLTDAFLAASGVTGSGIETALQTFETGLSTYSLTSKILAAYPLVGGTSATCAWNFMDTTMYPLSYTGSISFSNTGMDFGSTYTDRHATTIPTILLSPQEGHNAAWIATDNGSNPQYSCIWGSNGDVTPSTGSLTQYYFELAGGRAVWPCDPATGQGDGTANFTKGALPGFFVNSRTSNSSLVVYKNGSSIGSNTTTLTNRSYEGFGSNNVYLGGRQNNADTSTNYVWKYGSIGSWGCGLSATDASNYYTIVNQLQTDLGR